MDRWQYLIVLGACLLVTAPLELFGRGVYRQPRRLLAALVPVAAVVRIWDAIAVAAGVWWYNPRYILGLIAPGGLRLEEVRVFAVIPRGGWLTYTGVGACLAMLKRGQPRWRHR